MADTWILVANGSQAAIYAAGSPTAPLVPVETFANPDARATPRELVTDRPGRTFDSVGAGRHAKAVEIDPAEQVQIRFAKTLADRLEHGRTANQFGRLVLVVSPALLGLLRTRLAAPLRTMVATEIAKDYTALAADELRAQLPRRL